MYFTLSILVVYQITLSFIVSLKLLTFTMVKNFFRIQQLFVVGSKKPLLIILFFLLFLFFCMEILSLIRNVDLFINVILLEKSLF